MLGTTLATIADEAVEFTKLSAFGAPITALAQEPPALDFALPLAPRAPPSPESTNQTTTNNTPP